MADIRTNNDGKAKPIVVQRSARDTRSEKQELVFDIYTRFSDDKQHESSIERQIEVCREYAARTGASVNSVKADRDRTAMTMFGREGLHEVLANIKARRVNGILVEQLDRLTRDQADLHTIAKICRHYGAEIHEATGGKVNDVNLTFKGYMSEAGRERLIYLTSMGMRAAAEEGRTNGRPQFGYTAHPTKRGVRLVHPERACVVVHLFEMCDAGVGTTELARWMSERYRTPAELSLEDRKLRLPDTRRPWTGHMINKLLRSPFYKGITIYGAREVVRDFQTREVTAYRETPVDEWIAIENKELRIVDPDLWSSVQHRIGSRYLTNAVAKGARPMLADAVTCPSCQKPLVTFRSLAKSYRCNSPGCGQSAQPRVAWVEHATLSALARTLHGDALRFYQSAFAAGEAERTATFEARKARLEQELAQVKAEIEHTMTIGAMEGASVESKREFRQKLERRKTELQDGVAGLPLPDRTMSDEGDQAEFTAGIGSMLERLPYKASTPEGSALVRTVRRIVRCVAVSPARADGVMDLSVEFDLGPLAFKEQATCDEPLIVRETLTVDPSEHAARDRAARASKRGSSLRDRYEAFLEGIPEDLWQEAVDALGRDAIEVEAMGWTAGDFVRTCLFLLQTGEHPRRVPDISGPSGRLIPILAMLARSGGWERVAAEVRRARPDLMGTAQAQLMVFWTKLTARKSMGPSRERTERAHRLEREALACGDPRTARRMRCLSLLLLGKGSRAIMRGADMDAVGLRTWTNVHHHLSGRDLPDMRMPDLAPIALLADTARLEAIAADTRCPDAHAHVAALVMQRDGAPDEVVAERVGWTLEQARRWLAAAPDARAVLLAGRIWAPRHQPIAVAPRFREEASALLAAADRTALTPRRVALRAVGMHLEGRCADEIGDACGVRPDLLGAWLDVYGTLGRDGLILAVTSAAFRCPPGTMEADEAAMLAEADEILRHAGHAPDETSRRHLAAIALDIKGVPRSEICAEAGIRRPMFPSHLWRYRRGGVAAVLPVPRVELLTGAQVDELRAIVADGVDPLEPEKLVTITRLTAYCAKAYNRTLSYDGLRQILRRHGVRMSERKPGPSNTRPERVALLLSGEVRP